MERQARAVVFWPDMTNDIQYVQDVCIFCSRKVPSQAATPPMPSNPFAKSFEQTFADYFDYGRRHFLVIADRFSGWADVLAPVPGSSIAGAAALVCRLRTYFAAFGVSDEISTNGGPEFKATATIEFLSTWGVNHRMSSAYFPQSNWSS